MRNHFPKFQNFQKSHSEKIAVNVKSMKISMNYTNICSLGFQNYHYSTKTHIYISLVTNVLIHFKPNNSHFYLFRGWIFVIFCNFCYIKLYIKHMRKHDTIKLWKIIVSERTKIIRSCKKQMKEERLKFKKVLKSHFLIFAIFWGGRDTP